MEQCLGKVPMARLPINGNTKARLPIESQWRVSQVVVTRRVPLGGDRTGRLRVRPSVGHRTGNVQMALPRIVGEARGPPSVGDHNGAPPGSGEAALSHGVVRHKLLHFWLGPS